MPPDKWRNMDANNPDSYYCKSSPRSIQEYFKIKEQSSDTPHTYGFEQGEMDKPGILA